MKAVRFILFCFSSLLFFSCKKEYDPGITGKWVSQKIYPGYVDGGDFKWHSIEDQYKDTLDLAANGSYHSHTAYGSCSGTFSVTNHTLNIISSCGVSTTSFYFEYLPNSLIFYYYVREGVIKIKYSKID